MLINFIQFSANFFILMILLKIVQVHLVKRNPDSPLAQAFAFLVG